MQCNKEARSTTFMSLDTEGERRRENIFRKSVFACILNLFERQTADKKFSFRILLFYMSRPDALVPPMAYSGMPTPRYQNGKTTGTGAEPLLILLSGILWLRI
jgi:hypothetical protein